MESHHLLACVPSWQASLRGTCILLQHPVGVVFVIVGLPLTVFRVRARHENRGNLTNPPSLPLFPLPYLVNT